MKSIELEEEFQSLGDNFPNLTNEGRQLGQFKEIGSSVNVHFMKTNIKDLTDYLLCVLRKNCEEIYLDDSEYLIHCAFKDQTRFCQVSLLITQVDNDKEILAVEFLRNSGDYIYYYTKVKIIKNYLQLL